MYIIWGIFAQQSDVQSLNPIYLQNANPLSAAGGINGGIKDMSWDAGKAVAGTLESLFSLPNAGSVSQGGVSGFIGNLPLIGGAFSAFKQGIGIPLGFLLGFLAGSIGFIIFAIAVVTALFRLWFALIKAYIFLLIDVIFAPFWISLGLIPGVSLGFGPWLRSVVGNLSAFPITMVMFLLAKYFTDIFASGVSNTTFVPPLIGNANDTKAFASIIGIGIIMVIPQVIDTVKSTLKAPQSKFATGIGQAIGSGTGAFGRVGRATGAGLAPSAYGGGRPAGLRALGSIFGF